MKLWIVFVIAFIVIAGCSQPDLPSSTAGGKSIGPDDAAIVVTEFSDFQCPYCAAAAGFQPALIERFRQNDPSWQPAVPGLIDLAEAGKIRFVFKHFPIPNHQYAQKAAEAAQCADEQGKFWAYHDALFDKQSSMSITNMKKWAVDLGLDSEQFNSCLDSGKYTTMVLEEYEEGQSLGVDGTPTFFVNGVKIIGAQPFSAIEEAIASENKSE